MQALAENHGIQGQRFIPAINALHAKGVIPFAILNITTQLRDLRNRAAHAPEIALTQSEAERYLEQAHTMASFFRNPLSEATKPGDQPS